MTTLNHMILAVAVIFASQAHAVDSPEQILGKWSTDCKQAQAGYKETDVWNGLIVSKTRFEWERGACDPKSVQSKNGKILVEMYCAQVDRTVTYTYELRGNVLLESIQNERREFKYNRCK